jgi:hypothetical protein
LCHCAVCRASWKFLTGRGLGLIRYVVIVLALDT